MLTKMWSQRNSSYQWEGKWYNHLGKKFYNPALTPRYNDNPRETIVFEGQKQ